MAKPRMSFRKRTFLTPITVGYTSYVLAEVESSHQGEHAWGHNMLTMSDCRHIIELEFFLGNPRARRQSLAKINLLIEVLMEFREALIKEKELIEIHLKKSRARSRKKGSRLT